MMTTISLSAVIFLNLSKKQSDIKSGTASRITYDDPSNNLSTTKLLEYTNKNRSANSIPSLSLNPLLNNAALDKCKDFIANNYWSNADSSGKDTWHYVTDLGYKYDTMAQNIAYGYNNGSDFVQGWMNNTINKANILASQYTEAGIGVCEAGNFLGKGKQTIVVQYLAIPTKTSTVKATNPAPTTASTPISSSYAGYKPYTAPVCVTLPIPYKTEYKNVSYLSVGQTQTTGGFDGYTKTCTADSTGYKPQDITLNAYDKTVYVGTYQSSSSTGQTGSTTTREQRIASCIQYIQRLSPGSSAYQQCYSIN